MIWGDSEVSKCGSNFKCKVSIYSEFSCQFCVLSRAEIESVITNGVTILISNPIYVQKRPYEGTPKEWVVMRRLYECAKI